jgi:monoamine oxidase
MVDAEVVIVGAGAAGLAAAALLRRHGVPCLIIEARNRIGGRTLTDCRALEAPFDLGAPYLHAVDQSNPWLDIAQAQGEPTVPDPRRRLLIYAGHAVAADTAAGFGAAAAGDGRPHALADLLPRATMADHYVTALVGPWLCGEHTDRLDALDFITARHGEDRLVPGGYGRLVARFGAGLPVRLDRPVTAIHTRRDHVDLVTPAGTLRAGRVILTVPLGVLAAGRIRFEPPLPAGCWQPSTACP